jgi:hypothetical protein
VDGVLEVRAAVERPALVLDDGWAGAEHV